MYLYPCSARNSCSQSYGVWTSENKVHLIGPIIFLQRQSLSDQASASLCQWKYTCLIISIFQRSSKAADERNLLQKLTANRVKSPNVQREKASDLPLRAWGQWRFALPWKGVSCCCSGKEEDCWEMVELMSPKWFFRGLELLGHQAFWNMT